ncbi:hypothetical protein ACG7TL_004471 [Trametes sanguinea]
MPAFENYVQSIPGFNKAQKSRRTWQDGSTAAQSNSTYAFTSRVFVRRTSSTRHLEAQINFPLHDWIKDVTGPQSAYFANPDRPNIFELRDGQLYAIAECNPPHLKSGDLLWITFGVEFIIGTDLWSTSFVPFEIIRVGTVSPDLVGDSPERSLVTEQARPRPRLQVGSPSALATKSHLPTTGSTIGPATQSPSSPPSSPDQSTAVVFGPGDVVKYRELSEPADPSAPSTPAALTSPHASSSAISVTDVAPSTVKSKDRKGKKRALAREQSSETVVSRAAQRSYLRPPWLLAIDVMSSNAYRLELNYAHLGAPGTYKTGLENARQYWKNHAFSDRHIKLEDALKSLGGPHSLVEARSAYSARWVLCNTKQPGLSEAIFTTVGVFRWGYDPEVGNFVPKGAVASSGAFENYVQTVDGFNKAQKSRRTWQDGKTAEQPNSTYAFTSRVFVRRTPSTRHREAEINFPLHPWIKDATGPNSAYFANPDRPTVFELRDGRLQDIKDCNPPFLKSGNLIWISFGVEFIIGSDLWSTSFVPFEIIRVATVSPDLIGDSSDRPAVEPAAPRPRLQVGMRIFANEDFPMFGNSAPTAAESHLTKRGSATEPPVASMSASTVAEVNEVSFGPDDVKKFRALVRDREVRSASPVSWLPSPTQGSDNADTFRSFPVAVSPASCDASSTADLGADTKAKTIQSRDRKGKKRAFSPKQSSEVEGGDARVERRTLRPRLA